MTEDRESSTWFAIFTLAVLLLIAAPWFNDWAVWLKIVTDAGLLVVLAGVHYLTMSDPE